MIIDSWKTVPLGDATDIRTGKLDSNHASEYGNYPFFTCSPKTLRIDCYAFDCEAVLLAGNNANGIFSVKFYKGKFNAYQRTYVITSKNTSKLNNKFLYYQLKTLNDFLTQNSIGSATKFLTRKILDPLHIPLPPLSEQRAIAHILGTLDDKIELNHKMNEILEAMAQAIFKSWFVDFDPVIAKANNRQPLGMDAQTAALFPDSFEDSELGKIPKGWKPKQFGNVFSIFDSKRIPLSKSERLQRQGSYPYHGAAGVMDYVDDYLFDGIYVLMGEDGSVIDDNDHPVLQYVWGKFWVNNHAHVLQGIHGISTEHIYLYLQGINLCAYVTGAVQPKLNQKNLKSIPFLLPPRKICETFGKIISTFFEQLRHNHKESQTLATIRDTLLPKLLSGKLHISDAEKFVEDVIV
jgi:restriction endonuclease S subunit